MHLRSFNKVIGELINWIIAINMIGIVGILFVGVILRYIFNAPIFWAEEVTVLGLIWMTFLAGAILVRDDKNVCITVIADLCRPSHSRVVRLVSDFLTLIILIVMIWLSWRLGDLIAVSTTPALRLSEKWFAWAVFAGFVLMLYYHLQNSVKRFQQKKGESTKSSPEMGPEL